ncbi:hypothetical protein [Parabacteroides sp. PF5-6]|uniref:hypothetical protein n=1 Tax=Parabacteroides sp. PF5-6 TaxID=1742403 RepID=UPI0024059FBB|nr:hypothetical protein [Parabacteroides sp. PF5-6]MDF9829198.1 hypothetical protein [Parabacteroides sp. PF5-6]
MDKLKQFIDEHRQEFDDFELPEGHLARFEKKLPRRAKRHTLWYTVYGVAAAACIALFILFKPSTDLFMDDDDPTANVCEIEELQLYYTMQINEVLARIEAADEETTSYKSAQLVQASRKVVSDSGRFEEEILPTLPCSEEGIYVINQHYSNSLRSLQIMLDQIGYEEQHTIN